MRSFMTSRVCQSKVQSLKSRLHGITSGQGSNPKPQGAIQMLFGKRMASQINKLQHMPYHTHTHTQTDMTHCNKLEACYCNYS